MSRPRPNLPCLWAQVRAVIRRFDKDNLGQLEEHDLHALHHEVTAAEKGLRWVLSVLGTYLRICRREGCRLVRETTTVACCAVACWRSPSAPRSYADGQGTHPALGC